MTVDEVERLRHVLGAFYKTVDVMKSARNSPTHTMNVWADDMKAVEDVMFFLEQIRDGGGVAQAAPGPREVLDALADKVSAKILQLEHYKANECQLDHARTIAEGRISQANQILHWIAEAAVSHAPLVSSTHAAPRSEDQS